jgi:serine/threonine protein kinase
MNRENHPLCPKWADPNFSLDSPHLVRVQWLPVEGNPDLEGASPLIHSVAQFKQLFFEVNGGVAVQASRVYGVGTRRCYAFASLDSAEGKKRLVSQQEGIIIGPWGQDSWKVWVRDPVVEGEPETPSAVLYPCGPGCGNSLTPQKSVVICDACSQRCSGVRIVAHGCRRCNKDFCPTCLIKDVTAIVEALNSEELHADGSYWSDLGGCMAASDQVTVMGRIHSKADCFAKALEQDATNPALWYNLAEAMPMVGTISVNGIQYSKLDCFSRATSQLVGEGALVSNENEESNDSESGTEVAGYRRTDCYVAVLELDDSNPALWSSLAAAMSTDETVTVKGKRYTQTDCYVRALEIDPTDNAVWSNLALILPGHSKVEVAGKPCSRTDCFVAALNIDSNDTPVWMILGIELHLDQTVLVKNKTFSKADCIVTALTLNDTQILENRRSDHWFLLGAYLDGTGLSLYQSGERFFLSKHRNIASDTVPPTDAPRPALILMAKDCFSKAMGLGHGPEATVNQITVPDSLWILLKNFHGAWICVAEKIGSGSVVLNGTEYTGVGCCLEALSLAPNNLYAWQVLADILTEDETVVVADKVMTKQDCFEKVLQIPESTEGFNEVALMAIFERVSSQSSDSSARLVVRPGSLHSASIQGKILGPLLGQGASGVVRDIENDEAHALKIMTARDAAELQLMKRQTSLIDDICHHPNVVRTDEIIIDEAKNSVVHVMEKMDGALHEPSLLEGVNDYCHSSSHDCLFVARDVLGALKYLHEKGIVHGDIKPPNILYCIQDDGTITYKLADFDGARRISGDERHASVPSLATLPYCSPHRLSTCAQEPECDIWALGVTLHALRHGRFPFPSTPPLRADVQVARCIMKGQLVLFEYSEATDDPAEVELRALIEATLTLSVANRPTASALYSQVHQYCLTAADSGDEPSDSGCGDDNSLAPTALRPLSSNEFDFQADI